MNNLPPSSIGTNPDGFALNRKYAPVQIPSRSRMIHHEYRMLLLTPRVYPEMNRSNPTLNKAKARSSQFFFCFGSCGFNNSVQSAGVRDKATKADRITEMAIVIANC